MGDELETREKLLESAMAEFSENGYMKASLRKYCGYDRRYDRTGL